ncbi:hypothetical protein BY458DRAFT_502875 [Sporodiniella umbellata]|nr:hypothetical protein BY458DRAFT_502875 [Sporodiniella umbellata]
MSYGEADSYQGGNSKADPQHVARLAKQHAEDDDDDDGIFSQIASNVMHREEDHGEVDEDEASHAARAHDEIYNQNSGQPVEGQSSRDLGSAAAMQAFKMFSGGGNSGGGGSSQLIGLAMGEAQKLFKAQGGSSGGNNQAEMLQAAATMAMKLLMTQQKGNSGGGGGGLDAVMGILGSLNGGGQKQQSSGGGITGMLGKILQ